MRTLHTFTDTIDRQYWTVKEVADQIQVPESTIRYWCEEFRILTKRSANNYRKFTIAQVALLKRINHLLKVEGFTTEGCKKQLKLA